MCFNRNNDARKEAQRERERIEREEAERKARILQGQQNIDSAFAQFNDGYFDEFRSAFKGDYLPDLDNQFSSAKDKMLAALAGRGMLGSTVGANRQAELSDKYNAERLGIARRATDAANSLRQQVEQQKTGLYDMNRAAADPGTAAIRAGAAATALVAPQARSPIGDVFASVLQPLGAYVSADQMSANPRLAINRQPVVYQSPTGSSRIIK